MSLCRGEQIANHPQLYLRGVNFYLRWRQEGGHRLELTRAEAQRDMAELTVRLREAVRRAVARWLVEVGEPAEDPLVGLEPPRPHRRAEQCHPVSRRPCPRPRLRRDFPVASCGD
jgi:hypothetical protein